MKKLILGLALLVIAATACKKNFNPGFTPRGTFAGSFVDTVVLPLLISQDRTLTSDTLYVLNGKCYVTNDAVLTIDEGCQIEGVRKSINDSASALIVTRGSRIEANGSEENPIIFTSHEVNKQVGDWGGVVLLGSAPLNRADTTIEGINLPSVPSGVDVNFGGGGAGMGDPNDNSGILSHVRIEYAGAAISADNELNSLTLGGVGNGTVLEYIECAYGADDGFEFFGGTVNAKYLIALAPNDDAFDFDFGYSGNIQFAISVIDPNVSYSSNPNGIESDNNPTGALDTPFTTPTISNLTVIGVEDSTDARTLGLLNGAHFRRSSHMVLRNSVFIGFPTGVTFQSSETQSAASAFQYNIVHGFSVTDNPNILNGTNTEILGLDANSSTVNLTDPFNVSSPDFRPASGSALLSGANFTGMPGFFTTTSYRGACNSGSGADALWYLQSWAKFDY